jgi:DNA-binding transcriptional regulator YiaG
MTSLVIVANLHNFPADIHCELYRQQRQAISMTQLSQFLNLGVSDATIEKWE